MDEKFEYPSLKTFICCMGYSYEKLNAGQQCYIDGMESIKKDLLKHLADEAESDMNNEFNTLQERYEASIKLSVLNKLDEIIESAICSQIVSFADANIINSTK